MNTPEISSGLMVLVFLLSFGMMAAYPFAKAYLMYLAIKTLKFQNLSYWKAFFCVLIGVGATMAAQMVTMGRMIQPGREFDLEAIARSSQIAMFIGIFLALIAETISLFLFFKESPGKTIGAIALTYLFAIALMVVLFLLFVLVVFLVGAVSGLST